MKEVRILPRDDDAACMLISQLSLSLTAESEKLVDIGPVLEVSEDIPIANSL
jgi:hypothetical protein